MSKSYHQQRQQQNQNQQNQQSEKPSELPIENALIVERNGGSMKITRLKVQGDKVLERINKENEHDTTMIILGKLALEFATLGQ